MRKNNRGDRQQSQGDCMGNTVQIPNAPGEAPGTMQWWAITGEIKGITRGRRTPSEHSCYLNGIDRKGAPYLCKLSPQFLLLLFPLLLLLASCSGLQGATPSSGSTNNTPHSTLSTNNGVVTYNTSPQDVIIRTFYGGGNMGTLEMSPDISIYGDGTYILGPGLQMREGMLSTDALQQLLHTLVDTDGLLGFQRQQFYDIPDQNMTLLQLNLNGKNYTWDYGQFGSLQESTQDMDAYHRLGQALSTITQSLPGPTHSYTNNNNVLLVHEDFSPDLTKTIPVWKLPDFTLDSVAVYECGITPPDQTGPNGDTGCLSFTIPHHAYLLTQLQLRTIQALLKGQQIGVFYEQDTGLYYSIALRPLLPDELPAQMLAMYGSAELTYAGVPLHSGIIPTPVPTPSS